MKTLYAAALIVAVGSMGCGTEIDGGQGVAPGQPQDVDQPEAVTSDQSQDVDQQETVASGQSQALRVRCGAGYHLECDPNCEGNQCGKPICTCEEDPPTVDRGSMFPTVLVTHVVYAPPGRNSSIKYTAATKLGSGTSTSNAFKQSTKVTFSSSSEAPMQGGVKVSLGSTFGSVEKHSRDVVVSYSNGYTKKGQVDVVDHDDDEIWYVIRPRFDVTVTTPAPPGQAPSVHLALASDQSGAVPFWNYVKHLKNPDLMPEGDKALLAHYGVTRENLAEILRADPFAFVEPGATVPIDRSRFDLVDTIPYMRGADPGDQSSVVDWSLSRNVTNTDESETEFSLTFGYEVSAGFNLGVLKSSLALENSFTWTHKTTTKLATETSSGEVLSIGQPGPDYNGPALVRVYVDKIWKTFLFNLEPH